MWVKKCIAEILEGTIKIGEWKCFADLNGHSTNIVFRTKCILYTSIHMYLMYGIAHLKGPYATHIQRATELVDKLFSIVHNGAFSTAEIQRYLQAPISHFVAHDRNDPFANNSSSNAHRFLKFLSGNWSLQILWAAASFCYAVSYMNCMSARSFDPCCLTFSGRMRIKGCRLIF